ncbi:flippase-like domain-containing protein [Flavobacteriaceae bacterium F08102]|nr:flippase-like domain-containing protein [Flavobacteriaceae bacterium F08102]
MNKNVKKILLNAIPIIVGLSLVWYFLAKLSPDDKVAILNSFKSANYWWVGLSLILGILSHLSRAYRWKIMLAPMGYTPRFLNTIMAVMVNYLVNLGIPRAGEIIRATAISKYENIPVDKAIGTIVAERIADVIMLFLVLGTALFLQTELIEGYLFKEQSNPYFKIGVLVFAILLSLIGYRILQRSKHPLIHKIKNFIDGIIEGSISIFKMKNKWTFIFHTVFIWTMYILMFWVVTFAIPETANLPFEAIIVGFILGAFSMALTNGGLGTYPIFVASAFILYHVDKNPAQAFGWIMWSSQTLMVLIFGGLSFLFLPIYNRKRPNEIL